MTMIFVLFKVVIYTLAQSGRGSYWSAHNEHKHFPRIN
ncbi:hypothetical protein [Escherichia coli ISC41]|nr:hypothetical protein [Escherichia coli ISC41]